MRPLTMLRAPLAALLAAAFALPALAEDEETALKAYGKAVKNMNATDGYHIDTKIDVDMGGASMPGGSVEGVIRNPDFGHFKLDIAGNALDLFKDGDHVALLNPQSGKWEAQSANQTLDFFVRIFNLGTLLKQLKDGADKVEFGDPEEIGKRECRVVTFGVPKATLEKLIQGNGKGALGVSPDNTTMKVKTWIDRKDNLPRKIEIVIDVEMKGLPGAGDGQDEWGDGWDEKDGEKKGEKKEPKKPVKGEKGDDGDEDVPPMKVAITVTASIKNYGQELEVTVPEEAQKVLDAQKQTKTEPGDGEKK